MITQIQTSLRRCTIIVIQQKQCQDHTSFSTKATILGKVELVMFLKSCLCSSSMRFYGQEVGKASQYGTVTSIIGTRKSEISHCFSASLSRDSLSLSGTDGKVVSVTSEEVSLVRDSLSLRGNQLTAGRVSLGF